MKHKIGEQWVEELDGKRHMLKALNSTYNCNGCAYLCDNGKCSHESIIECPVYTIDAIIKDLGVLNEDGCLPSVWSNNLYPQVYRTTETIWYAHAESYGIFMEAKGKTKQEAIDAWNRRT